jgi:hypothetical protein
LPREEAGTFTEWMVATIERLAARLSSLSPEEAAELEKANKGETDPHRLIDYSLDKSYDVAPYSAEDMRLHWVEDQDSVPYRYGLFDDANGWHIPMGKTYRSVKPFRGGVAQVIVNDPSTTYGGPWTQIHLRDLRAAPAAVAPAPRPPSNDPILSEFRTWLLSHPGPQRATLLALAEWIPRLVALGPDARTDAARLIRNVVKSPKLADARESLIAQLS